MSTRAQIFQIHMYLHEYYFFLCLKSELIKWRLMISVKELFVFIFFIFLVYPQIVPFCCMRGTIRASILILEESFKEPSDVLANQM